MKNRPREAPGPFLASQLRDGDRYELSDGHPIHTSPAGGRHAERHLDGGSLLGSDPEVEWAGVDAGFSPGPRDLRAPDVAVGGTAGDELGWVPGAPPLAVEYASIGQDDAELAAKVTDLLEAGTRFVWVVRLLGPRRVEVHELVDGKTKVRVANLGESLQAPGILRNPVPVRALFERDAAFRHTLRNLLQRQGYDDLEAVLAAGRDEGRNEGRAEGRVEGLKLGLLAVLTARGLALDDASTERVAECRDAECLQTWLRRAQHAVSLSDVFDARN